MEDDLQEAALTSINTGAVPEQDNRVVKKVVLERSLNPKPDKKSTESKKYSTVVESVETSDSRAKFASLFVDVSDIVPGTIDGETYISMEKDAGKRWRKLENGRDVFVNSGNKDDKLNDLRLAVAAYIGYKNGDILGLKLSEASRRAKMEINPLLGGNGKEAKVFNTNPVWVKGLPDPQQRFLQNLKSKCAVLQEQYDHSLKVNGESASETKKLKVNLDKVKISLYKIKSQ